MQNSRLIVFTFVLIGQIALTLAAQSTPPNDRSGRLPGGLLDQEGRMIIRENLALYNDVAADSANARFAPHVFSSETKFASKASKVVGTFAPGKIERSTKATVQAATALLDLLDEQQKAKLLHKLDSPERSKWTNLPVRPDAGGLRFSSLNEDQLTAALRLLAHMLSAEGYEKMRLIMLADDQLLRNGRSRPGFGTENFAMVLFGTPSETDLWSIQLDGHHVGVNIAIAGDSLTIAPSFIGTQPVKYELGGYKIGPMQFEIEQAFKLAGMLNEEQFKQALISDRRRQIRSGPGQDNFTMKPEGIACKGFNDEQRKAILDLIGAWVNNMPKRHAKQRMIELYEELNAGKMFFSWNGSRDAGSDVSYTIQSESLVIEFAYQNLGGDPLNHLHTQFRNPKNDYGKAFSK